MAGVQILNFYGESNIIDRHWGISAQHVVQSKSWYYSVRSCVYSEKDTIRHSILHLGYAMQLNIRYIRYKFKLIKSLWRFSVGNLNQIAYVKYSTKYFNVRFLTKNARFQTQTPTFSKREELKIATCWFPHHIFFLQNKDVFIYVKYVRQLFFNSLFSGSLK